MEVQVGEFPQAELPDIIAHRSVKLLPGVPHPPTLPNLKMSTNAKYLGNFYHAVRNTASNITMREVVKWIRRCHMLNLSCGQSFSEKHSEPFYTLVAKYSTKNY